MFFCQRYQCNRITLSFPNTLILKLNQRSWIRSCRDWVQPQWRLVDVEQIVSIGRDLQWPSSPAAWADVAQRSARDPQLVLNELLPKVRSVALPRELETCELGEEWFSGCVPQGSFGKLQTVCCALQWHSGEELRLAVREASCSMAAHLTQSLWSE